MDIGKLAPETRSQIVIMILVAAMAVLAGIGVLLALD